LGSPQAETVTARPTQRRGTGRIGGSLRVGFGSVKPPIFLDFALFGPYVAAVIRRLVDGLASRPEIAGVAVISGDGLVIEQALGHDADADAIAALTTTIARHGHELGTATGRGFLGATVFDFANGPAVMTHFADGMSMILLARPDADLGEVLYLLRRQRDEIAGLL